MAFVYTCSQTTKNQFENETGFEPQRNWPGNETELGGTHVVRWEEESERASC